jgi:hypothetical protein
MNERIIDYQPKHPTQPDTYWCRNCETWVKRSEMSSRLLDDDKTVEKWCPGCDLTLLVVEYPPAE